MRTKEIQEAIKWIVDDPVPYCKIMEYQPGNGTRYVISFARVPTSACKLLGCQENSWVVSLLGDGALSGSAVFTAKNGFLSPSYVKEKLRLTSYDDSMVLTEIIGLQLGRPTPEALDKEGYVGKIQLE